MSLVERSKSGSSFVTAPPRKGMFDAMSIEHGFLYLAVFLSPYALLRFSDLFFTVSDFLFCICLALIVLAGRVSASPLDRATPMWVMAFTLLFAGLMLSSILKGDPTRGFIVIVQYLFSYMILLAILLRDDFSIQHKLAGVFIASVLLVDIHGIITFYTVGFAGGAGRGGVVTGSKRLATVLRNPNLAAAINSLTMPLLLYFWSTGRLKPILALPMAAVLIVTVVLTSSNSGLMMMATGIAVFVALIATPRLVVRLLFGGGLAIYGLMAFGGASLLPKAFHTRVLSAFESGELSEAGTFMSRSKLITEATGMIENKSILFLGIGADQFREISVQQVAVHNLYLLLWVEGGLLALIGWLMFAVVGGIIWLAIWRQGGPRPVLAVIAASVATFLTVAMFYPHMYARYWTIPILLSYGLGIAHWRRLRAINP